MAEEAFTKIGHFKDVSSFMQHVRGLGIELPCDEKLLGGFRRIAAWRRSSISAGW